MRRTLMLNLDDRHARFLDDLSKHFRLSTEDTARFAIRLTHDRIRQKPDVLTPEFKPRSRPLSEVDYDDREPG